MSTKYKYKGTVHQVGSTQTWPSGFKKRTLVLKDMDGKFESYAAFDFTRDRVNAIDGLRVGETVEVEFFAESQESTRTAGQWFTNMKAVGISRAGGGSPAAIPMKTPAAPQAAACDDGEEMPF